LLRYTLDDLGPVHGMTTPKDEVVSTGSVPLWHIQVPK
jgi:hypothetical protein